jgi:DNA-binding XRE family transcriptional regulator
MSESFKNNRLYFKRKGLQRNFILKAQKSLGINQNKLAQKLKISQRTLYDWSREKITISQNKAGEISKISKILIPKNYTVIDWRLRFQKAGKIGGKNKYLKYGSVSGNEEYRKEMWENWWNKIGKFKQHPSGFKSLLKIKIPKKSKLLAEFVGIMLGDGNISRYHIGITLSSEEKKYSQYVQKIIKKLFGVVPSVYKNKRCNAVKITVNRKSLVDFCQKISFEMGNKINQQVDIPIWIKENKIYSRECIRGLFDTDGCFFFHNYNVRGKKYSYLKIDFTSASIPLVLSVREILINLGFNVRISKNRQDVRIEDSKYVCKYIKEIGSHNDKHLQRIKRKVAGAVNGTVC